MMETISEAELSAQRYVDLFKIAFGSLENYKILRSTDEETTALSRQYNKIESEHYLIICMTFAIAAIEAFINHLGYIYDNDWKIYEGKNFYDQKKRICSVFAKRNILVANTLNQAYPDFETHRKSIRNPIQHPHSSRDDVASARGNYDKAQLNKLGDQFLNLWPNVTMDDAEKAVNGVEAFISNIVEKIEEDDQPLDFSTYKQREHLRERLLSAPFSGVAMVTTVKKVINKNKMPVLQS